MYGKDTSLENNNEEQIVAGLSKSIPHQSQPAAVTDNVNNHHRYRGNLGEEAAEENVYHILENPGDNDDYEDLDKYELEKRGQDQDENVYHILDGPTVVEEGVATSTDVVQDN